MQMFTLSFLYFDFGPRLGLLVGLEAFAVARLVLVFSEVEVLHALVSIVVVTAPAAQIVVRIGRFFCTRLDGFLCYRSGIHGIDTH